MPNIRPINKEKYKISKNRFLELYHHCLQYTEWKQKLLGELPEEKKDFYLKMSANIEKSVEETDAGIYSWLLEGVTNEGVTYEKLKASGMPCNRSAYYKARREFYKILSKNQK